MQSIELASARNDEEDDERLRLCASSKKKVLLFSATVSIPDLVIPRQATLPSNRSAKVVRLDSVCSASEIMAELEREKASNP